MISRLALSILLALALAACGGKKAQATDDPDVECEVDDDCGRGERCKDSECVETEQQKIRHKSNNLTPVKVKREVEARQKEHTQSVDKSLDL